MRPLGRCGRVLGGGTPSKDNPDYWDGDIPWVTAKEMWNDEVLDSQLKITERALKASPAKLIPANSVLFVVRGSILFKRVPVAVNRVVCTINQDMKAIVPGEDVLGDYLALMMRALNDELKALVGTAGNSAGKLETEKWSAVEIPVPPLVEQRRLVARVEALTSRLEQARQARQAAIADAVTVGQAVWDRTFTDIPPEEWKPIGAHAKVQGGYAFKSEWFAAKGIRLLRNQNVYRGNLDWRDTVHLPPSRRGEFQQFELAEGDIVITMDRPLIKSGLKAARVCKQDLPCLLLQRVGRFLCDIQLDEDYLLHFLFSQSFIPHISGDGRSCAVPHISAKQIEAIPIPLPSRRKQGAIVARLDTLRGKLDELQRLQREVEAELESFTPALLAKAFRGEL
jgi:type I restriction enzyme, S subunit